MKEQISIVTVTYNAANYIVDTIQSVISQTYPNKEYVIIDGNSNDGTQDIVKKYADKIDVFVSETDKGIYDAMNKAIDRASGEWIIFMNAGDSFYNNQVIADIFENKDYTGIDVIYGSTCYNYSWGNTIILPRASTQLSKRMPFVHQSVFTRTSIMKDRHFNSQYRICADFDFFHWLYENGGSFKEVEAVVSNYAGDGISRVNIIKEYDEIERIIQTPKTFASSIRRALFIFRSKLNYILPEALISWYRKMRYN